MGNPKFGNSQYEAHISLGKMSKYAEDKLIPILNRVGFKVIDLAVIKKEGLEKEPFHIITTAHSKNLNSMCHNVSSAVDELRSQGYKVIRYKIESTVYDSKFEDKFNLLDENDKEVYRAV